MIKGSKFLLLYALITGAFLYMTFHSDVTVPVKKPLSEFPVQKEEWRMTAQASLGETALRILKPADYLLREYHASDGTPVLLHIGYYSGGKDNGGIHSPKHCLPGGGWLKISEEEITIPLERKHLNLVKAVYQKDGERELFLYWYQVKGQTLSDEYALKLHTIANSILYHRRDTAFVRISLSCGVNEEKAFRTGEQFVRDFYPVIAEFLPE